MAFDGSVIACLKEELTDDSDGRILKVAQLKDELI